MVLVIKAPKKYIEERYEKIEENEAACKTTIYGFHRPYLPKDIIYRQSLMSCNTEHTVYNHGVKKNLHVQLEQFVPSKP